VRNLDSAQREAAIRFGCAESGRALRRISSRERRITLRGPDGQLELLESGSPLANQVRRHADATRPGTRTARIWFGYAKSGSTIGLGCGEAAR
jgi:hypothetical protein